MKEAILCRQTRQEPFGEIDANHLYHRPRYLSSTRRRHSVKVSKLPNTRRKLRSDPPLSEDDSGDVFCRIPVEELDQQGVFAVRDVIVAERPIYEFPTDANTHTGSSRREPFARRLKKSNHKKLHSSPHKRAVASSAVCESPAQSALDDWSQFLDVLLPSLCVSNQLEGPIHSSGCSSSKASSKRKKVKSTRSYSDARSVSSLGACFSSHHGVGRILVDGGAVSRDDMSRRRNGERRHPPPSPTGLYVPAPVVYPIARYPSRLNNKYLVEQRRLSLREHLTFRPVPAE